MGITLYRMQEINLFQSLPEGTRTASGEHDHTFPRAQVLLRVGKVGPPLTCFKRPASHEKVSSQARVTHAEDKITHRGEHTVPSDAEKPATSRRPPPQPHWAIIQGIVIHNIKRFKKNQKRHLHRYTHI